MNRNSAYLDEIKKRLSPFAQRVFDKLLDLKKESNDHRNIQISYNRKERDKKKEILFDDFSSTSLEPISMRRFNDIHQFSTQEINESSVSVSTDLLYPVRNDVEDNISIKFVDKIEPIKPMYGTTNINVFNDSVDDIQDNSMRENRSVDWNELFDSNFFESFDDFDILKDVQVKINDNVKESDIPSFTSEDKNAEDKMITSLKRSNTSSVDGIANNFKVKKARKVQRTKEPSLRKEKYIKTVKNWLNNGGKTALIGNVNVNIRKDGNKSKIKKTVQTQLSNKGGVMKFAIPKDKVDLANTVNESFKKLASPNEDNKQIKYKDISSVTTCGTDTTPLQTESSDHFNQPNVSKNTKVRGKTVQSKFIAPFSPPPAPVKHVTYKVRALDEHSLTEHIHALQITNFEITTVLLYSNGFNQLNGQYASTACTAEGIVLHIHDTYYYIKHFGKHFEEPVLQLLNKNTLVCFNAKEVLLYLMTYIDVSLCDLKIIDLKIGASLLSPDEPPNTFSGLQKLLQHTSASSVTSECVLQKCARDMCELDECDRLLRPRLVDGGMWGLFEDIEMKALPIVAEMEHHGVCVDVDLLKSMESTLLARMKEVEQQCYRAAGRSFQINSALQVRTILYEELQLDTKCNIKIRETVCKAKSTSEAMLLVAEHPLPRLVLQYRHLHKAHTTFVAGILQHVRDGVVKPTWEQSAAVTGRIACHNPNLQAIPRAPFSLLLHPEDAEDGQTAARVCVRDALVARAGRTLLAADFRHAECRVLAQAARDRRLAAALQGQDLFSVLAAEWLHQGRAAASPSERARAKRLVYGALYGAGPRTLARLLRDTPARARALLDSFHSYVHFLNGFNIIVPNTPGIVTILINDDTETFPSLKSFGRSVVTRGTRQGGRLLTPGGRARIIPHLASQDAARRARAQRQAVNFIVQGSAADLCKAAMAAAARRLRGRARLVLQVHDELVWDLPAHLLRDVADEIKAAMEGCGELCGLRGPFPVRLAAGPRWGRLAPLP